MSLWAFDIDGTIDSAPDQYLAWMQALKSCGHTVVVLTGTEDDSPTQQDLQEKAAYLQSMGLGQCWDQLVLVSRPHAENKAKWLTENKAAVLVDNDKGNIKAAADVVKLVLVPWATRE